MLVISYHSGLKIGKNSAILQFLISSTIITKKLHFFRILTHCLYIRERDENDNMDLSAGVVAKHSKRKVAISQNF